MSARPTVGARALRGAGDGTRTRDPQLGRLMLYQLSYSRIASGRPSATSEPADSRTPDALRVGREGFEPPYS